MDDPFHSLNNWDQVYTEPDLFESILSTNSITGVFKYIFSHKFYQLRHLQAKNK